ncbi:MAG: hypothetical protein A3E78_13915 [Alphaproteobacteria bacterium RIFCSPHIGHO2_12_FULL_63_12]|nr:MAG: hypothetical protein A3E78_13915 [Alphaproteobacteria bacterium RIFCSPHIGHO2_12_FULL_63_12]
MLAKTEIDRLFEEYTEATLGYAFTDAPTHARLCEKLAALREELQRFEKAAADPFAPGAADVLASIDADWGQDDVTSDIMCQLRNTGRAVRDYGGSPEKYAAIVAKREREKAEGEAERVHFSALHTAETMIDRLGDWGPLTDDDKHALIERLRAVFFPAAVAK